RFTRMLQVRFRRAMTSLATDRLKACSQALAIRVAEAGTCGMAKYALFLNRAVKFQDISGCVAWGKIPAKTVEPRDWRLEQIISNLEQEGLGFHSSSHLIANGILGGLTIFCELVVHGAIAHGHGDDTA